MYDEGQRGVDFPMAVYDVEVTYAGHKFEEGSLCLLSDHILLSFSVENTSEEQEIVRNLLAKSDLEQEQILSFELNHIPVCARMIGCGYSGDDEDITLVRDCNLSLENQLQIRYEKHRNVMDDR